MRFAGMQGIKLTSELAGRLREQSIPVPKGDSIYVRIHNDADNKKKLLSQEVVLNHFFNIAFDIADDATVSELLCDPLGLDDAGPSRVMVETSVSSDLVGLNRPTSPNLMAFSFLQTP